MEKQTSPSKNSPTKSLSPPPQNPPPSDHNSPMETNLEAERIPPPTNHDDSPMETNLEAERIPPPSNHDDSPMETNLEAERIPPPPIHVDSLMETNPEAERIPPPESAERIPPPADHVSSMETNPEAERIPPPADHVFPMETNPKAERIPPPEPVMKTALEVLAELSAGDEQLGGNNDGANAGGNAGAGGQSGGSVAVAIGGSGSMVVEGGIGGVSGEGQQMRKRRNVQIRDPPPGNPRCPECGREFSTWKAAFGHMRKHPERAHRGFFPPPSFDCPTNRFVPEFDDGPGDNEISLVRKLVTGMNQSLGKQAGSSSNVAAAAGSSLVVAAAAAGSSQVAAAAGSSDGAVAGSSQGDAAGSSQGAVERQDASDGDKKGKKTGGIDLNQPPPPEDEDMNEN